MASALVVAFLAKGERHVAVLDHVLNLPAHYQKLTVSSSRPSRKKQTVAHSKRQDFSRRRRAPTSVMLGPATHSSA